MGLASARAQKRGWSVSPRCVVRRKGHSKTGGAAASSRRGTLWNRLARRRALFLVAAPCQWLRKFTPSSEVGDTIPRPLGVQTLNFLNSAIRSAVSP